jgi:hypothetical protein
MAKNSPIPVRLDEAQTEQVRKLSLAFGVSEAQFIRWAVAALISYVDAHGGNLSLPIDFSSFWKSARQLAEDAIRAGTFPESTRLNEDPALPVNYLSKRKVERRQGA